MFHLLIYESVAHSLPFCWFTFCKLLLALPIYHILIKFFTSVSLTFLANIFYTEDKLSICPSCLRNSEKHCTIWNRLFYPRFCLLDQLTFFPVKPSFLIGNHEFLTILCSFFPVIVFFLAPHFVCMINSTILGHLSLVF